MPPNINNTPDGNELTGTGEPGSIITLSDGDGNPLVDSDGNPITTTVGPDGNWSVSDIDPDITDGETVMVTSTDDAGNRTSTSTTPAVGGGDTTPPVPPNINNTPNGNELTGTGEPGAEVEVFGPDGNRLVDFDGNPITTTVDENGNWSISDIDPDIGNGDPITVRVTDSSGNSSSTSEEVSVGTGDTTAPAAPTVDATPDGAGLTGTGEPGSTITLVDADGNPLLDQGGNPVTATVDGTGSWEIPSIAPPLRPGQSITATGTDAAGNSRSVTRSVVTGDVSTASPEFIATADVRPSSGGDGNAAGRTVSARQASVGTSLGRRAGTVSLVIDAVNEAQPTGDFRTVNTPQAIFKATDQAEPMAANLGIEESDNTPTLNEIERIESQKPFGLNARPFGESDSWKFAGSQTTDAASADEDRAVFRVYGDEVPLFQGGLASMLPPATASATLVALAVTDPTAVPVGRVGFETQLARAANHFEAKASALAGILNSRDG